MHFTSHKSHEETPVLIIATGNGAKKAPKTWERNLGRAKLEIVCIMCVSRVDVRWSPEAGQSVGDVSSMAGMFSADCSPLCAAVGIQIEFICLGQFQFKYPAAGWRGDGEVRCSRKLR